MLRVVGQQCCKCLHTAKHLTGFKLCTTTPDTTQQLQVIQTDATCNIQQCGELLSNYFASVCIQLKMIYVAHVWYINMTPRLSGHIYKCGLLVFGIKSLLGFARRWSREKLAILSLKPLIYQTWTIFLPDLLIYFTIKLESLTNASDASTELILQFPCKLKKNIKMHCRWKSTYTYYFFSN